MKTFVLSLFLLLAAALSLPAPAAAASAEDGKRYAVAATEDVWFYAGESEEERLFLIPATYYVRVLEEGELYCTVEYQADDAPYKKLLGYCRTEQLLFVSFVPVRPYLRKQVTLTYTLPDAGGLGDAELGAVERTFAYYGARTEGGQLYYYVFDGERFGYVPAETPVEYERNDDYLQAVSGGGEADPAPQEQKSSVGGVQIAVICVLCVAAVAVAVLVLRGKKPVRSDPSDF